MRPHEVFVFLTKLDLRERMTAIEAQHRQARLRAAAKPLQSLLQQFAVGIREAERRPEAVLRGHRLEVLHHHAIFLAPAEQNPASLCAAVWRGGKSFADFLVDAFHRAPANSDGRRPRRAPGHIFELHFLAGR